MRPLVLGLAGATLLLAVGVGVTRLSASAAPAARGDIALAGEMTQGGWARGTAPLGTIALTLDDKPVALAPDRSFFLAFDRDAGTAARVVAKFADGGTVVRALTISPRAWRIERIPLGPKPGTPPSEAYRIRREGELKQINAARAIDSGSQGWRQRFIWPAKGRLSGVFGSQRIYNGVPGSYHSGTDIATGGSGTPFAAPADGVVILAAASPFSLEGNLLMIDHGMGLNSAFLHCSQILVKQGEAVKQGQIIGRIGATGRATGPHLHWSIKWRDSRLDPILFTGPMQ
ncbi:M23 family metallopeptidase [Novosphingobium sp. JCM 18896]|uniref:M23 family metallopeptidase n=1 Tax=Novosphingobium sp. JCM 18896 TaxID=2989731 RepID=UPI002223C263|nr:M23 family metallopeptidase [Novosphingobium sp. JCM 18896]MCW1429211.1 M23 family metallopeptidase [Novosphingobium sp. JCM 18896]